MNLNHAKSVGKLLDFLIAEEAAGHPCPTKAQITQHMGWKEHRPDVMARLEGYGYVRRNGFEKTPDQRIAEQRWALTEAAHARVA